MDDLGDIPMNNDESETEYCEFDGIDPEKIPFKFMDIHHLATKLVIEPCMKRKILPESGFSIVTFNTHIDDLVPEDMQLRLLLKPNSLPPRLFDDIGRHSWLKSLAEMGHLKHVIFIKSPWTTGVLEGSKVLLLTNPENESNGIHEVSLDIKTCCRSVFENIDEDYDGFQMLFSKYLSPDVPYILDFTLSFFSSDSPFRSDYSRSSAYYNLFKELFKINEPLSMQPEDIEQAREEREKHLKELEIIFKYLETHREFPAIKNISEINYQKVSDIYEELLKYYSEDEIQWYNIFAAGLVSNDYQLPVHITERKDIEKMVNECVSKIIDLLPCPPSAITVAVEHDFEDLSPEKDLDFIIDLLKELFANKYQNLDRPDFIGYG